MFREAQNSGAASPEQLATLKGAAASRTLSWDDYHSAVVATLECFEHAGVEYLGPAESNVEGLKMLSYAAQTGEPEGDPGTTTIAPGDPDGETDLSNGSESQAPAGPKQALADACRAANSQWVEAAWESQPSSLDLQDAYFKQHLPQVLTCAKDAGVTLDENLPVREILAELVSAGEVGRQCLQAAGITAF